MLCHSDVVHAFALLDQQQRAQCQKMAEEVVAFIDRYDIFWFLEICALCLHAVALCVSRRFRLGHEDTSVVDQ